MKTPRNRYQGFTLMEMLMVVLLLAVLLTLGMSAGRSAYARSRNAACMANLRSLGMIFHRYASDHNGGVRFLRDGAGAAMWYNEFQKYSGLSDEEAKRAFACPALPSRDNGAWYCYGMRVGYFTERSSDDPGFPILRDDRGATYGFKVANVLEPSRFLLMADTATASGRQSFRIADRKLYSGGGICLRHEEKANFLFLDGHVESLTAAGCKQLGFTELLSKNLQLIVP